MEVDESLSFLDVFVSAALQNGALPYVPRAEREETDDESGTLVLVVFFCLTKLNKSTMPRL